MAYPKGRSLKECKKVNCKRHAGYLEWNLQNSDLKFCHECKHAHVSQYESKTAK